MTSLRTPLDTAMFDRGLMGEGFGDDVNLRGQTGRITILPLFSGEPGLGNRQLSFATHSRTPQTRTKNHRRHYLKSPLLSAAVSVFCNLLLVFFRSRLLAEKRGEKESEKKQWRSKRSRSRIRSWRWTVRAPLIRCLFS